jgi:hypothetical protein
MITWRSWGCGCSRPASPRQVLASSQLVRGDAPRPTVDLWWLGATLYAAVEGRLPFHHRDAVPTLATVLHDPPASAVRAARLQPHLARLLIKDPIRRLGHDDVQAMLADAYPTQPTARQAELGEVMFYPHRHRRGTFRASKTFHRPEMRPRATAALYITLTDAATRSAGIWRLQTIGRWESH